ncbi:MAG: endonuclease/exonuclease/phosphatase family protein [Longimicrobiales bacterium]
MTALAAILAMLWSAGCGEGGGAARVSGAACRRAVALGATSPGTMHWRLPADSAPRAGLDAYCAAVGPALVFRPAADPTRAAEPADTLVVIAWNAGLGAGDLPALLDDLGSGRLTSGPTPAHFILLLQEVHRSGAAVPALHDLPAGAQVSGWDRIGPAPPIDALARSRGLHLLYVPSVRNGLELDAREDHGNAVLSTLPLTEPAAHELPLGIRRRVAAAATVTGVTRSGTRWQLRVASAHLDNFSFRHLIGSFGSIRARQARALAAALPDTGAVLLGADLNTWLRGPAEAAFGILHGTLPRPGAPQPQGTARRLGLLRRLDYVLLRAPASWALQTARLDSSYGSDHHPVQARIVIGR